MTRRELKYHDRKSSKRLIKVMGFEKWRQKHAPWLPNTVYNPSIYQQWLSHDMIYDENSFNPLKMDFKEGIGEATEFKKVTVTMNEDPLSKYIDLK